MQKAEYSMPFERLAGSMPFRAIASPGLAGGDPDFAGHRPHARSSLCKKQPRYGMLYLNRGLLACGRYCCGDGQMREASFPEKTVCGFPIQSCALRRCYCAAVPVAVFLLGWLKPWWGVPAAALLAAGVLCLRPGRKGSAAPQETPCACRHGCWPQCWPCAHLVLWGGQGRLFLPEHRFCEPATAFCTTL